MTDREKLIDKMLTLDTMLCEGGNQREQCELILDALEAEGFLFAEDDSDWEYGALAKNGRVMRGSEDFAYRSVRGNALPDLIETVRRRKAGPWMTVEP